eukprot:sb/3477611/
MRKQRLILDQGPNIIRKSLDCCSPQVAWCQVGIDVWISSTPNTQYISIVHLTERFSDGLALFSAYENSGQSVGLTVLHPSRLTLIVTIKDKQRFSSTEIQLRTGAFE